MHPYTVAVSDFIDEAMELLTLVCDELRKNPGLRGLGSEGKLVAYQLRHLRKALCRERPPDYENVSSQVRRWRGSSWELPFHICDLVARPRGNDQQQKSCKLPNAIIRRMSCHDAAVYIVSCVHDVVTQGPGAKPPKWHSLDNHYLDELKTALRWLDEGVRQEGKALTTISDSETSAVKPRRADEPEGPTLTPDAKPSAANARAPRTPKRKRASKELVIDENRRLVFWKGKSIAINAQADFDAMVVLGRAGTAVAKYLDLDRAIKAKTMASSVTALKQAPPEVKEALSHINRALCVAGCPSRYKSVRKIGYRLEPAGVCPTFTPRSHDE